LTLDDGQPGSGKTLRAPCFLWPTRHLRGVRSSILPSGQLLRLILRSTRVHSNFSLRTAPHSPRKMQKSAPSLDAAGRGHGRGPPPGGFAFDKQNRYVGVCRGPL